MEVSVLRVFCGPEGDEGNPLGVVLDGPAVVEDDRQALATHLGYSETVFVDDRERGVVQIFTPQIELPFAGHPALGTAWLLAREGYPLETLRPPAGEVGVRHEGEATRVTARPEWCPPFELVELGSPEEVDAQEPGGEGWRYLWAWIERGDPALIRARCFVPEAGIEEDEATGSAALLLCAQLDRPIEVRQGRGSVIHARPIGDGSVELAGVVRLEEG